MESRTIIALATLILTLASTRVATAQTWDGDDTKIGTQQPGGFDYNWATYAAGAFGDRTVRFDYSGARPILHAPAVGVHPRIYFNPEEIPAIANRLNTTNNGKEVAKKMRAFNILLHKGKAGFNTKADYNTAQSGMAYVSNAGASDCSEGYQQLLNGDTTNYNHFLTARANKWTSALCMEAFECLLKKGQPTDPEIGISYDQRATDLATVMTAIATTALARGPINPANGSTALAVGIGLAIAYDLNYWALTPDQRNRVRQALAAWVPNQPAHFGDAHEPYATTGNWAALDSAEPIVNFAIEGEAGYKPTLTKAWMRVMYNFVTYGWDQQGCPWEGIGKNYLMVGQQLAFAKRGFSLLGHPNLKAYGRNYLPRLIQPFGFAFMGEDTWGGFGLDPTVGRYRFHAIDAIGYKYAYPNDPAVDFVWRNYTHNTIAGNEVLDYANTMEVGSHNTFDIMTILGAYAEDSTPGDWTAQNKVALQNNLDFFEDTRGQAILRSDFTPNALLANFYVRQNFGGHTYADRNDVAFSALGRIWFTKRYGGRGLEQTDAQSCLLVDGKGMSIHRGTCKVPAKMERWKATNQLSQATGDAAYAYSWEYNGDPLPATEDTKLLGQGWVKETKTLNDFRANPAPDAYYNIPFYDFAYWGDGPKGTLERMVKRPFNPMEKVFRTVAMTKGKHPFLMIVDDLKKDANPHQYDWVAQLPEDIELDQVVPSTNPNDHCFDVLLKEKNGDRKLLVRVLNQSDYATGTAPAVKVEQHAYVGSDGKNYSVYRLAITSHSVSPDFRILVFPFRGNQALPLTTWSSNKTTLRVDFNDEHTTLSLINNPTGSTSVQLVQSTVTATGAAAAPWSFTLTPNPARTAATLELSAVPGAGTAVLTLLDGLGRAVRTETVALPAAGLRHELSLAGLAPGVYLLRATAGATAATRRLVVE